MFIQKSQRDFNELERMISENMTSSSADSSGNSRLSLDSKSQSIPQELSPPSETHEEGKPHGKLRTDNQTVIATILSCDLKILIEIIVDD